MQDKVDQVTQWILSYLRDEISESDKQQLDNWIAEDPANQAVWQQLLDEKQLNADLNYLAQVDTNAHWQKIATQLTPEKKVRFHLFRLKYIAAAAVVIGLAFTLYYYLIPPPANQVVDNKPTKDSVITPGGDGAVLTLSDGSSITLDSMKNGVVAQQGNIKVLKKANGELSYQGTGTASEVEYHVLSTPRGKKWHVNLPDGSVVWLNAASSLRYPSSFIGAERRVELSGEAYFEIAKDQSKPFHVTISPNLGDSLADVEVIGTHFNINAYYNEASVKTTLLEGKLKVSTTNSTLLSPGQQAQIANAASITGTNITVINNADVEQAVAWKNDLFNFDNMDLKVIMRQIERWYNVDVVYEGNIGPRTFGGGASRFSDIDTLLNALEYMNVHFRVEGRKIIVTP